MKYGFNLAMTNIETEYGEAPSLDGSSPTRTTTPMSPELPDWKIIRQQDPWHQCRQSSESENKWLQLLNVIAGRWRLDLRKHRGYSSVSGTRCRERALSPS